MWSKKIIEWVWGKDLYQSIVFTWDLPKARTNAILWKLKHKSGKVFVGGPAVKLMPNFVDWGIILNSTPFDVLSFHNPLATFTTRGCINKCSFCAVPKIEPNFEELSNWKIAPVICDNNFFAASKKHRLSVYKKLKKANFKQIDFNQGLDTELITEWDAKWLYTLKTKVRFAFDHISKEKVVKSAIDLVTEIGSRNIGCYVLIGYKDTPKDALNRLEKIRSWGFLPSPMRYQPLNSLEKNKYISSKWDRFFMEKVVRYYSRLIYLGHIPFSEYKYTKKENRKSKNITNRKSLI